MRLAYRLAGHFPAPIKRLRSRLGETAFLVGVIGVVLDSQGRLLLFRHSYRPFAPWGLPSGWLQEGEDLPAALAREIEEETGLQVGFDAILKIEPGRGPTRVDVWMKCHLIGGVMRPSAEVEAASFFAFDDLPPLMVAQEQFLHAHRTELTP